MTDNIVHADFGKAANESARRLARLLDLAEKQERALLADPKPFLDRAHDEIVRLRRVLREAQDALHAPVIYAPGSDAAPRYERMATVTVPQDQWQRWKRAIDILEAWERRA